MITENLQFRINGQEYSSQINPGMRLLDLLRNVFNLTGTKEGCGEGTCGACTVLLNGETVNACLVLAGEAAGNDIVTIEGLSSNGQMSDLQKAFVDQGAVQCGFCTPGMILSAKALLDKNPHPTEDEIREGISGNLCRCTGYVKIVKAIQAAAGGV